jgi:ribosomal protein L11 methyltransferase
VVESYYDGLSADQHPEEIADIIDTEADALPVLVYCEDRRAAEHLSGLTGAEFPELLPVIRLLPPTAAVSAWSDGDQFTAGRFELRPADQAASAASGRLLIQILSGTAFGSGNYVTTIAMLRALDTLASGRAGGALPKRVLDIGTGNGVLLIAASLLGATDLTGTDLSADIIAEARRNIVLNNVQARTEVTDRVPENLPPQQLVMANIPVAALRPMLPQMLAVAAPDAVFLFAGFTTSEGAAFRNELSAAGLSLVRQTEERGWSALLLSR